MKTWRVGRVYTHKLTPEQLSKLRKYQFALRFGKDKTKAKMQLNHYKATLTRLRRDAQADSWDINGVSHSRQDIMFKVLDWITDGNTLKMFCEQPGAPSVGTIYKWFKNHPEFEKDYRLAEESAAHIMADKALTEVLHLTDKEEVPIAKLQYDALTRRAAQMSQKFQDKQVFRQEEDIKSISDDELRRRREELMAKVKEELRKDGWNPPQSEIEADFSAENPDSTEENEEEGVG